MLKQDCQSDYDPFAWFYDRYWSLEVPPQIMIVIDRLLVSCLPRGASILDLCCGTGYTCAELIKRGFKVTGLDRSKEMLRRARRRAHGARFMLADARSFELPPIYQGVISTFDSLNHVMTLDELTTVFRNVRTALAPSGLFLFDMNMEKGFLLHWVEYFAIVETNDVCVLKGAYDRGQRIGHYDVTMFRRKGEMWQRTNTEISEKCYTMNEIKRALRTAGFREISTYDAEKEMGLREHVGRTFFLARR